MQDSFILFLAGCLCLLLVYSVLLTLDLFNKLPFPTHHYWQRLYYRLVDDVRLRKWKIRGMEDAHPGREVVITMEDAVYRYLGANYYLRVSPKQLLLRDVIRF